MRYILITVPDEDPPPDVRRSLLHLVTPADAPRRPYVWLLPVVTVVVVLAQCLPG